MNRLEGRCFGEDEKVHINRGFVNLTLCGQAVTSAMLGPVQPGKMCEKCTTKMEQIRHELARV